MAKLEPQQLEEMAKSIFNNGKIIGGTQMLVRVDGKNQSVSAHRDKGISEVLAMLKALPKTALATAA